MATKVKQVEDVKGRAAFLYSDGSVRSSHGYLLVRARGSSELTSEEARRVRLGEFYGLSPRQKRALKKLSAAVMKILRAKVVEEYE